MPKTSGAGTLSCAPNGLTGTLPARRRRVVACAGALISVASAVVTNYATSSPRWWVWIIFAAATITCVLFAAIIDTDEAPPDSPSLPSWAGPTKWATPWFEGRAQVLVSLAESPRPDGAVPVHVLLGLGGVGKSQLAVRFAHEHEHDFDIVCWTSARSPSELRLGFTALATELKVGDSAEEFRAWLRVTSQKWLLILDDALGQTQSETGQVNGLASWIPETGSGYVLITSRDERSASLGVVHRISTLSVDEAVLYLEGRTRLQDKPGARALAVALGGLPLALAQAAAYLDFKRRIGGRPTYGDFVQRLNLPTREAFQDPAEFYQATVASTWGPSLEAATAIVPSATTASTMLAVLSSEPIPLELLSTSRSTNGLDDGRIEELSRGFVALATLSLIEMASGCINVHNLVKRVMEDRSEPGELETALSTSATLIQGHLEQILQSVVELDTEPGQAQIALLPHAVGLGRFAAARNLDMIEISELDLVSFTLAFTLRLDSLALEAGQRVLSVEREEYAEDHIELYMTLQAIGRSCAAQGRWKEAISYLREAWSLGERLSVTEEEDRSLVARLLAGGLFTFGHYDEAVEVLRAVTDGESDIEPASEALARAILGAALCAAGRSREGDAELREAELLADGSTKPLVRFCRGQGLLLDGRFRDAAAVLTECLALFEATGSPARGECEALLARACANLFDRLDDAIVMGERGLATAERIFGQTSPLTAIGLNTVSVAQLQGGLFAQARITAD